MHFAKGRASYKVNNLFSILAWKKAEASRVHLSSFPAVGFWHFVVFPMQYFLLDTSSFLLEQKGLIATSNFLFPIALRSELPSHHTSSAPGLICFPPLLLPFFFLDTFV